MTVQKGQVGQAHGKYGRPYTGSGPARPPRCPICKRPTTPACAEHPEYVAENFLRRAENLLAGGTLTPYQAHKLRKALSARTRQQKGGAM